MKSRLSMRKSLRKKALLGSLFLGLLPLGQRQVMAEDAQEANFAFFDCVAAVARNLDDGKSDFASIAAVVQPKCHSKWVAATALDPTDTDRQELDRMEITLLTQVISDQRAKRAH